MSNKKPNIASQVRTLVEKQITDIGYTLWDVTFYKEGAEQILEVAIDKKGGVSIEDCSRVTKIVEPLIDELDPIEEGYCLMVSSAGCDRDLNTTEHIEYAINEMLKVEFKLFTAFEGKKEYFGIIKSVDTDTITATQTESGIDVVLPKKLIAKMKADFDVEIE